MATVDKNFKVKHGLVVEGTTGTINGEDIITTGSSTDNLQEGTTNQYYTESRAKTDAAELLTGATLTNITITGDGNGLTITAENGVADSDTDDLAEGSTNLYFTAERAQDAVGNSVGQGLTYDDAAGAVKANINSFAGAIGTHSSGWLEVKVDGTSIDTSGSGNQLRVLTGEGSPVASKTFVNNLIGDNTVDGTSGNTITDRIATAVSNLVDGAPDLLNTLNELAAAIGDDENYATTVAGLVATKQDTLIAGNGININPSTDEISVDDTVIASVDYVDTNFVSVADLPGQLDDYVPLTQKGANDGVATLDSTGQVPLNQLGNVPDAYITALGNTETNLAVSNGELALTSTPKFEAVNFGSSNFVKQVATLVSDTDPVTVTALSWPKADYRSAKLTVSTTTGGNTQVSELLIAIDDSDNVAITEYGMVYTSGELASITADISGNDVRLRVTLTGYGQPVTTTGTLIKY